jgi:ribonuclease P protein component
VYELGQRHFASHMTVFYLAGGQARGPRIGFTVSRALGGAVIRNRMRRRLREAVRTVPERVSAAVDIVINPKKSLLSADFLDIQREIVRAFGIIERKCGSQAVSESKEMRS